MKLNYSFSKREIAMILVLLLVLIGLLYYRFVYLNISNQVDQYNTADLEAEIQLEQLQLIEWEKMKDEIDSLGEVATSSLETYDNQKEQINLLNDIFEPVIRYNFSFEKPVATGDTVRRNVSVDFTTIDYQSALDIIKRLHFSRFRVLLHDISITPGDLTVDYLTALATEALVDPVAMIQLKKQVKTLIDSNLEVSEYVMKVYRGEPLTEAPETETAAETLPSEGAPAEGGEGQETPSETMPAEGGTVETLADGTIVAPRVEETESESETETETEKPVQTLENSIVNVKLSLTFYETIYGATNFDGLIIEKPETPVAEEAG